MSNHEQKPSIASSTEKLPEEKMPVAAHSDTATTGATTAVEPRRSFGQKVKAHFRRFWYLHLISFIFFTILISLLL